MTIPSSWETALAKRSELPDFKDPHGALRLLHTEDPYVRCDRFGTVCWYYWYHLHAPGAADFELLDNFTSKANATRWVVRFMQNRGADPQQKRIWQSEEFTDWEVVEHDIHYLLKANQGLSPGLFLDQKENRRWLKQHVEGKRVANLFSYTGAFGLCAAAGGAQSVINVDTSKASLDWARSNAERNSLTMSFSAMDAREFLKLGRKQGQQYDVLICDPPSFARSKKGIWKIETDLPDLVRLTLPLLAPSGVALFSSNFEGWSAKRFQKCIASALPEGYKIRPHDLLPVDFQSTGDNMFLKSCLVERTD